MELIDYLRDEYEALCFQYEYRVAGLEPSLRTARPRGVGNSVAWVSWHMARNEDVLINWIIGSRAQALDQGWTARLGVDDTTIGTGYSEGEVAAFSDAIDVEALDGYARSVAASTRQWLQPVEPDDLVVVPDVDARLKADPPCLSGSSSWVAGVWRGRTAAQQFAYFVIGHGYTHFGEIEDLRASLGVKGL